MKKKATPDPALATTLTECQISLVRISRYVTNLTKVKKSEQIEAAKTLGRVSALLDQMANEITL